MTKEMTVFRVDGRTLLGFAASLALSGCQAPSRGNAETSVPLEVDRLDLVNVVAESVNYHGRSTVRLTERPGQAAVPDMSFLAILGGPELAEGSIELLVAGAPQPDASPGARGFVGAAFHVREHGERYHAFYLRPTNGRAEDQARRNHATQYQAVPGYPWHRLRSEEPGVYESYVDLEPDRWTEIRIELRQNSARLFVHGNPQPSLVVSDMKTPDRSGQIALWIGPETVGYFAGLRVRPGPAARD